jgi:hypothetical protein
MARVFALLLLWLMQTGLVVLLVNAEWVSEQARLEQTSVARQFGQSRYAHLERNARSIYDAWFIETGIQAQSYARLLPDPTQPQRGMEGLAPWFFEWLKRRLNAFWWLVFQGICRVLVLREWLSMLLLVGAVAALDGLIQRQIKRSRHALASADRYLFARRALLCLLFAPFVYLSLPMAITPSAVPIWGACLAIVVALLTTHAQHRI